MEKRKNRILNNQKGFTLIEIISVLVLLGILAAVAVPKFINLQTEAATKAADAAVAEGVAQVNLYTAKYILINSTVPTKLADLTELTTYEVGDFTITFAVGTDGDGFIKITALGKDGTSVGGASATRDVALPSMDGTATS